MLPFEVIEARALKPAIGQPGARQLPLYAAPLQEEALYSWMLRLATRLGTSVHALTQQTFGVDDRAGLTQWWCRPNPWLLNRMGERTGIAVKRLRQMTFHHLEPAFREDEANERFCYNRYTTQIPEHRAYRFVACDACLREDQTPYLRLPWLLGWIAVCPVHKCVLIDRCNTCHAKLRVGPFAMPANLRLNLCTRCELDLLDTPAMPAEASVLKLQARLLEAKQKGSAVFEGIGRLSWPEAVSLADILLGTIFRHLTLAEQEEIQWAYGGDTSRWGADHYTAFSSRYGILRLFAWLLSGWPDSDAAKISRTLVARWRTSSRNWISFHLASNPDEAQYQIPPEIGERLTQLTGS